MAQSAELPSSPWSSGLPPEVSAAVLRCLPSHTDLVRFAAVCRPWRAAVRHLPRPPPLWLALPDGTLYSLPGTTELKLPCAARYHGSCGDWLIFRRDGDGGDNASDDGYLLLNPFSGETMRLPGLSCVRFVAREGVVLAWKGIKDDRRAPSETSVSKMVMCPGQIVAAIAGDGVRLGKIVMWRPGTDFWCISAHDAWRRYTDIAYYDGKVYAVEDSGDLFAMDFGDDEYTGGPKVAWARLVFKGSGTATPPSRSKAKEAAMRYMYVSGGKLMMVRRRLRSDATADFAVFRADFARSRWLKLASVGDDMGLFVGRWSSVALRVPGYGLPGNRVYFVDDDALCRGDCPDHFGAYDMADGVTYQLLPPLELSSDADTPATWLFPSERMPRWCDLPEDLFDQVLRLLSFKDHARLSVVCRDWSIPARRRLPQAPRVHCPKPSISMSTAPAHRTAEPPAFRRSTGAAVAYLALPNGQVFRHPELTSRVVDPCGSYCGAGRDKWLLFKDDRRRLRLKNPFTRETRLLPSLDGVRPRDYPTEIVDGRAPSGSAVATSGRWSYNETMEVQKLVVCPDGLVAAVVGREHFAKLALCSLKTSSWSLGANDRWRWYEDLAFHYGKLYALTADEDLLAFDVSFKVSTGEPMVSRVKRVIVGSRTSFGCVRYLVPSRGGELLMVQRRSPPLWGLPWFTVFRADLTSRRWTEVDTLAGNGGKEALFVGRYCSRAVYSHGRGDQIFFLTDDCLGMSFWDGRESQWVKPSHHAAVYNMMDRTVTNILPWQLKSKGLAPSTWLFPEVDQG